MTICSPADSTVRRQALEGIRRTRQHSKVALTVRKTVRKNDARLQFRGPSTRRTHAKLKPSPVFLRALCGKDFDRAAIIQPNAALANAALKFQTANRSVPIFELVNLPSFK